MSHAIDLYIANVEMLFIYSPVVSKYSILEKDIRSREGYIRVKAYLSNGDIFEAFEFAVLIGNDIKILTYRLHWQNSHRDLKKRWDSAEHHREVATFPYHIHDGDLGKVQMSEIMSIQKALKIIEAEILNLDKR
ncbi:hypothetical protein FJZ33_00595 [Candidatus Poribacteria bacterium]|nr:hypothetical protein [Candidatus Poribacteria bacterium]